MSATSALFVFAILLAIIIAAAVAVGFYLLIRYAWLLITAKIVVSVSEIISTKKQK